MTPEVVGGGESRSAREAARAWICERGLNGSEKVLDEDAASLAALLESHAARRERNARAKGWDEAAKSARKHSGCFSAIEASYAEFQQFAAMCEMQAATIRGGGGTVRPGQEGADE